MRKVRVTSTNFSVRSSYERARGFLYLDPPYPKDGDYEWALRMTIDKFFYLVEHPDVEDGGSGSCGLCLAAGHLSDRDNPCNDCPIKIKTGKSNCEATAIKFIRGIITFEESKDIYMEMLGILLGLYKELHGVDYLPEIMEEQGVLTLQSKNRPSAGMPGGPGGNTE